MRACMISPHFIIAAGEHTDNASKAKEFSAKVSESWASTRENKEPWAETEQLRDSNFLILALYARYSCKISSFLSFLVHHKAECK